MGMGLGMGVWAQEDFVVNRFDAEEEAVGWVRWWGSAPQLYEYDPSMDASGQATSGSMKATVDFDRAAYAGENQFAVRADFPGAVTVDGTKYTNFVFKLRWAGTSPKTAGGDFGYLEYGFRNSDWSQTWLGGQTIPAGAADSWTTIQAAVDPKIAKLDTIAGVVLKLWSGGDGGLTGSTVFWVDDVVLLADRSTAPPPPPGLRLLSATSGLRIAASASGAQYQRQNVRTLAADADGNPRSYGWLGRNEPVTYSFTVRAYPDAAHLGFQTHVFLVPEAGMPFGAGDTSIDWNAPNVVFLHLENLASGSATMTFRYKTNLPSGNAMFWNADPATGPAGSLGSISDVSPLGTWSVTFRENTQVTLTAPSGSTTNLVMPADAAGLFSEPLYAYFGTQPNNPGNIGQAATLSKVSITGVSTPLDDGFTGEVLDAGNWAVVAADAPGVMIVPTGAKYWLAWDAPATGFIPQSASKLSADAWSDPGFASPVQVGSEKRVLVLESKLPSAGSGFFRLIKP